MGVNVSKWLTEQGFRSNPFEFCEADREADLKLYFVPSPWFDEMLGDTRRPRSTALFAPRGYGKSAYRREVARLSGEHSAHPALVIEITDFDWLLAEGAEQLTTQRYVRYLVRCAGRRLLATLERSAGRRRAFSTDPQRWLRLHALLRWAEGHARAIVTPLPLSDEGLRAAARHVGGATDDPTAVEQGIAALTQHYTHAMRTEILSEIVALAQAARFVSIYALVDRLDESAITEGDTDMIVRILRPLISDLHLIEFPGLAVKFFLPDDVHAALSARQISRIGDRIPAFALTWSDADLLDLLRRRLRAYSQVGGVSDISQVNSFQDLCEPDLDADRRIVATARGSPRGVITTAAAVIARHCAEAQHLTDKIPARVIEGQLRASRIPKLHLDNAGVIWLDGRPQEIPLTALPRRLLQYLWDNRSRSVPREELSQALYSEPRADDALYKLVTRLRAQLEPHLRNSRNYIDYVEGRGFRLQSYEDTLPDTLPPPAPPRGR